MNQGRNDVRAVVTDLDGTLLNDAGVVGKETVSLLKHFQKEQGGIVIFATSRHLSECVAFAKEILIEGRGYIICANGKYVFDSNQHLIKEFPGLNREQVQEIRDYLKPQVCIVSERTDYIFNSKQLLKDVAINLLVNLRGSAKQKRKIGKEKQLMRNDLKVEKIIGNCKSEELRRQLSTKYDVFEKENGRVEVQNKLINKAEAVRILAEKEGLINGQIIVFGDDFNDERMLREFENSYCMENAKPKIKTFANAIAPSNNNQGVYCVLKEILEIT